MINPVDPTLCRNGVMGPVPPQPGCPLRASEQFVRFDPDGTIKAVAPAASEPSPLAPATAATSRSRNNGLRSQLSMRSGRAGRHLALPLPRPQEEGSWFHPTQLAAGGGNDGRSSSGWRTCDLARARNWRSQPHRPCGRRGAWRWRRECPLQQNDAGKPWGQSQGIGCKFVSMGFRARILGTGLAAGAERRAARVGSEAVERGTENFEKEVGERAASTHKSLADALAGQEPTMNDVSAVRSRLGASNGVRPTGEARQAQTFAYRDAALGPIDRQRRTLGDALGKQYSKLKGITAPVADVQDFQNIGDTIRAK